MDARFGKGFEVIERVREFAEAVRAAHRTTSTDSMWSFALFLFPTPSSLAQPSTRISAYNSRMSTIKRPIQIEEFVVSLRDVPDEQLYSIKHMITQYIAKLHKTNTKLQKLAKGEEMDGESDEDDEFNEVGPEDKELFKDIISENVVVVRNYEQRIDAVENELAHRGLPLDTSKTPEALDHVTAQDVSIPSVGAPRQGFNTDNDDGDSNAPNSILL